MAYRLKAFDFGASVHLLHRVIGMDIATPDMVLEQIKRVIETPFVSWRGDVEAARVAWERVSRDLRSRVGAYEWREWRRLRVLGVCRARLTDEAPFVVVGT